MGASGIVRAAAGLTVAALVITGLFFGRDILMPLALAILLGFVLDPAVTRLRRWGLPRVVAVFAVVVATLALLGVAALLVAREVRSLSAELPTYQTTIKAKLTRLRENIRAPGMFDGLTRTMDLVQHEAETMAAPAAAGAPRVQPVEIREKPASPVQQAAQWLERAAGPLVNAGIVLVFVVMVLLDRLDLRDRLLRLMGGNLHLATDAMDEAGERISRYLLMQLCVNLSYGIPMALGLWIIGVPGALLWGLLAAVMRYVPYVGPMISAAFPLTLAFTVDPGWSLLLWTLALLVMLELVSNNLIEPWLYGSSTGLSAISLIVAATFWTALWGPVGLVMSTPLTVCLLVIGRYLPALQFLDVLLGSQPALDARTRIYQRLLGGDVDEAIELGQELTEDAGSVAKFYDDVGIPVLRRAANDHQTVATAEHRLRLVSGMEALLDDLMEQHPPEVAATHPAVLCLGGKWEVDTLAARMLAHTLSLSGTPAADRPALASGPEMLATLDLQGVRAVCVSWFSPEPQLAARRFCRRLRRRWPDVHIVLALWNTAAAGAQDAPALGADAIASSLMEAVMRVQELLHDTPPEWLPAPVPERDAERVHALRASGMLDDPALQPLFDRFAKRAATIFDMPFAMVSTIDEARDDVRGAHGQLPAPPDSGAAATRADDLRLPREQSFGAHVVALDEMLVVPDTRRDPRFATHPIVQARGLRFYAGAPLRGEGHFVLGALCVLDVQPRSFSERDAKLLGALADDLMEAVAEQAARPNIVAPSGEPPQAKPSATVGQVLPGL